MLNRQTLNLRFFLVVQIALICVGCQANINESDIVASEGAGNGEESLLSIEQSNEAPGSLSQSVITETPAKITDLDGTPTKVFATPMPEPTESVTQAVSDIEEYYTLYLHLALTGYGKIEYDINQLLDGNQDRRFSFVMLDETEDPVAGEGAGPGDTTIISFANYSNLIAYWLVDETGKGQLWLSDLELANPKLVFTDEDGLYKSGNDNFEGIYLEWSPDDRHVFLLNSKDSSLNIIYHIETDRIESWPWDCNSVSKSPRTNRLALYCVSTENSSFSAVIEWGGEIWFDSESPPEEIVRQPDMSTAGIWAWSGDGQLFAYLDPQDGEGALKIVTNQGTQQFSIPNAAWWQTEAVKESKISLPTELLHWSQNGNHILVFGHELNEDACPKYVDPFAPLPSPEYQLPCWQIINTQTGLVEWTWNDFLANTEIFGIESWQVWYGSISPVGNLVVFQLKPPLGRSQVAVVNVTTGKLQIWESIGTRTMRWRSIP